MVFLYGRWQRNRCLSCSRQQILLPVPSLFPLRRKVSRKVNFARKLSTKHSDSFGTVISKNWRRYSLPLAFGIIAFSYFQLKESNILPTKAFKESRDTGLISLNSFLNRLISRWVGFVTKIDLRFNWMKNLAYNSWAWVYTCDLQEIAAPLESYQSLSEFFTRELKEGSRHIEFSPEKEFLVSPVDGRVSYLGRVELRDDSEFDHLKVEQIKNVSFTIRELLGPSPSGFTSRNGYRVLQYIVLYLAPGDYHHFHSPTEWTILQRRHFKGSLAPVRAWAVKKYPGLYCMNERITLSGKWLDGQFFSLSAVGALNVGSINLEFDKRYKTNSSIFRRASKYSERNFGEPKDVVRGQKLGTFDFGSTIVLIFESSEDFQFSVNIGEQVRVGERIGSVPPGISSTVPAPPWPSGLTV